MLASHDVIFATPQSEVARTDPVMVDGTGLLEVSSSTYSLSICKPKSTG